MNYKDVSYTNDKRKSYLKTHTLNHIKDTIVMKIMEIIYRGGGVKMDSMFLKGLSVCMDRRCICKSKQRLASQAI
jgi:hypothetical protein